MLHLCGLANVLPAERRYPNQRLASSNSTKQIQFYCSQLADAGNNSVATFK